jgi:hypothetical protein
MLTCAVCNDAVSPPSAVQCGPGGTNTTVLDANYTCNAGYYKATPPVLCAGMC